MSLMEQIKKDQLTARKERSWKASILTTLLGEAAMIGKNAGNRETTDPEVIAVIKKFIKNMEETARLAGMDDHTVMEIDLLSGYLPKGMDNKALVVAINEIILEQIGTDTPHNMGSIMKRMKEKYDGLYDGKEVSGIVRELLK